MRQLPKFRAWDKQAKKMIYFDDFNNPEIIDIHGFPSLSFRSNNRSRNADEIIDYEIMQSTGLFDKNEVEIYEGDIVKLKYIQDKKEKEAITKIIFEEGAFMLECISGDIHDSCQRALFTLSYFNINPEIIGNIHQNPELLIK